MNKNKKQKQGRFGREEVLHHQMFPDPRCAYGKTSLILDDRIFRFFTIINIPKDN